MAHIPPALVKGRSSAALRHVREDAANGELRVDVGEGPQAAEDRRDTRGRPRAFNEALGGCGRVDVIRLEITTSSSTTCKSAARGGGLEVRATAGITIHVRGAALRGATGLRMRFVTAGGGG